MGRERIQSRRQRERSVNLLGFRLCCVAAAVIGGAVVSGVVQSGAASDAADAQMQSSQAGIAQTNDQFNRVRELLQPYVSAGNQGLSGQQALLGLMGPQAQQQALDQLQQSPQFTSALKLGESSILANASATGGLRGGNTEAALAKFSPALLASTINDQYSRLGGMTSMGQNAAAGVGNAGMQTGQQVSALLAQQGAAQAGGALAQGRAFSQGINGITSGFGMYQAQNSDPMGDFIARRGF